MAEIQISDFINGLTDAGTLAGTEKVYLQGDVSTTTQDIANLNSYTLKTHSELSALSGSNGLIEGSFYYITDADILIQAISETNLSASATRLMRIVKNTYYLSSGINLGVWWIGLTPSINDVVIWGGQVWINNSGAVGSNIGNATLSADWDLVDKSNDTYYLDKTFFILYDFTNNWVSKQYDDKENEFGIKEGLFSINPVDISDWGNDTIRKNKSQGVYNNRSASIIDNRSSGAIYSNTGSSDILSNENCNIYNNSNTGRIWFNHNVLVITGNSNGGAIEYNRVRNIQNNSNSGTISNNRNNGSITNIGSANTNIINNTNNGNIATTTTGVIEDTVVDK